MEIKAILFDKDGVLVDFAATFAPATVKVLSSLADGDHALMSDAASRAEFDLESIAFAKSSRIIAGSGLDIAEMWGPVFGRPDLEAFAAELDVMYGEICNQTAVGIKGMQAALDALASIPMPLGIATNDAELNATRQMERLGTKSHFSRIFGADSGFGAKPGPGMIFAFSEHTGISLDHILMVGDSLHDLEAGKAAGVRTCGVGTGPADLADLEPHADIVLPSIAALPQLVGKN